MLNILDTVSEDTFHVFKAENLRLHQGAWARLWAFPPWLSRAPICLWPELLSLSFQ